MASTPFGEHLRRERELRGVSLDEVSAATRIKTSFLVALENGRWNELPGGAFNRGFIRATSRFLGLDEDGMVAEYALETGGAVQNKPAVESAGALPRDYRPAAIAISVLLLVVIVGAWFAHHEYRIYEQKQAAAALTAAATSAATVDQPNAPTADPDAATASVTSTNVNDPQPSKETTANAATTTANVRAVPETLKLKVAATKRTEVKVVGDGKTLFKGHIRSDAPKTFVARNTFEVTAGEADLVQLELNGRNIPFAATTGHRGSISLNRNDLKSPDKSSH
jgi:cytoskeleton protein RodZ